MYHQVPKVQTPPEPRNVWKTDGPTLVKKVSFIIHHTDAYLAWRCHTHNSSQNVSLRPLHWAVIMGRVSTEPGKKMPLRSIG